MGPPAPKEKLILNVGRFGPCGDGTSSKRQEVLLKAFKGLTRAREGGWRLCLAGSLVPEDMGTDAFGERLIDAAAGYPVTFEFNTEFGALRELYRRASVYWHATGYGFPAGERPERQEHFGNTTVEAMSAGAVPVVINSGGQKEIVTHEYDGLLWDSLPDLAGQTLRLVEDAPLLDRLSRQAVLSSGRFGRRLFTSRVDEIIKRLTAPGR